MKNKFLIFGSLFLAAILVFFFLQSPKEKIAQVDYRGKGIIAPPFLLSALNGEEIKLADFQGKVVILDFWATWCPPCREGIPILNQLYREFKGDGVVVIGISLDRGGTDQVKRFVAERGVEYINVMGTEEVFQAYSSLPGLSPIQGIPTAFVVDRQGQICRKFVGLTKKETLTAAIKAVL
jgi:thiol-disulfide isomerase/thioredoxin